ncbi:SLC13 family permease [Parasporobacterium paucivorans]|uniref:Solute carrier family 13 (Sodium-dependent dicarboxylate transporter), member 2/3/5 n=1 Tax=Parasporobacterium paucivorans DSM 15970 TaxID=1122934 RepID=A0A1M6LJ25_9FIRM|nr:SLC13 family permease [Parasporobacterium paucivorans]SHJ71128.1 solute carrier family 13 (sodium-dependent dicarboxylate transporter), member 2/3/5 [Parasporobacterium paucivorans DSM 15970]
MKKYTHYIIALIIGLVLLFALPETNGLTNLGVRAIAVMVPILYLWLTTNTHWVAILSLALLILTQVSPPNVIWATSFGHFVVPTIICFMVLNECLRETGVIHKIAIWFITRPFVKGRPIMFLSMFMLSSTVIGQFMDNMSLAIIYIGIAAVLCEEMGYKKGDPFYTAMFIAVLWPNVVYSISSPIAHALPNILMGVIESQTGIVISYGQWLAVGLPFAAVMFVVMVLVMRLWNPDSEKFRNFDMATVKNPPLKKEGKIAAVVFILVILMIILPEVLKTALPGITGVIRSWGVVVPAIFAIAILSIINVQGKPIMDFPKCTKAIPLPAVLFAGIVSCFAPIISAESTGISAWMGNSLRPIFEGMPVLAVVIIMIICATIMTNFLSNTVTMVLFFNLGVALLATANYNMGAFGIIIGLAASMAACTPSAAVPSPLFFGPEHITMKNSLKWNTIFIVVSMIVIIVGVVPFANALL